MLCERGQSELVKFFTRGGSLSGGGGLKVAKYDRSMELWEKGGDECGEEDLIDG